MSTLVAQTISNGTVSTSTANVINGAKAWVNFNGSGGASIRASYNVSSVNRTATGNYQINFTNAMPDTNYAICSSVGTSIAEAIQGAARAGSFNTGSVALGVVNQGGTAFVDNATVTLAVFR